MIIFYSPVSGRQIRQKYYIQNQRKKYNLTDKKIHQSNYSTSYCKLFAVNCESILAALLTTVTLGKSKFKTC